MTTFKKRFEFFLPLGLGLYCLVQGAALAINANPVIQVLGFGLLLPVPAFAYYTWHGRRAVERRTVAALRERLTTEERIAA